MLQILIAYWPHILAVISIVMASIGIVHAAMTKDDVRSATGWVGVMRYCRRSLVRWSTPWPA